MARLERGFAATGGRSAPKSDKGFKWPGPRRATDEQRGAFRKTFTQLVRAKGFTHRDLARELYGQTRDKKGYVLPRNPGALRDYLDGAGFPTDDKAELLAAYFKVPMQQLLQDDGQPFDPLPLIRPLRATKARLKSANGHGHKGNGAAGPGVVSYSAPALAASEPAPLPKPPKGAKPVQVEIKTLPGDANWCQVNISGTVQLDVALGLVAFIERAAHKSGPRK